MGSSAPDASAALRVVALVSGAGTVLESVLDAAAAGAPFVVRAVGSDRDGTGGVARAEARGIPAFTCRLPEYPTRDDWNLDLVRLIAAHEPDLVVLAGFMKVLGPAVLAAYPVINTHPALLPSFPGAHGVRDALAHGVMVTGATCHWVDAGVDTGPIIEQRAVRVEPGDTVESLHDRIKAEEREMLVGVLTRFAADRAAITAISASRHGPGPDLGEHELLDPFLQH
ncbi:MAG: phosphoribosylglycinamide formyltransferase [Dermatophilaceae bacterium]